jgi:hypothetical protein
VFVPCARDLGDMYIVEKFPKPNISFQNKHDVYPGGGWSIEDLERYLNSKEHFKLHTIIRSSDGDLILVWEEKENKQ